MQGVHVFKLCESSVPNEMLHLRIILTLTSMVASAAIELISGRCLYVQVVNSRDKTQTGRVNMWATH